MAEADHYPRFAHSIMSMERCEAANPTGSGSLPAPRSGHATAIIYFAYLIILEDTYHQQNVIISSLYHPRPLHKISSQSVHTCCPQTNRQTDKPILPKT